MEIFTTKKALQAYLSTIRQDKRRIGLVPTMGALHDGHLALINRAKAVADVTVCSIFVNPTQFNDPADLEKYPRPIEQDKQLLQAVSCDVLFLPEVGEMYGQDEYWHLELGVLDRIWEGEKRPGHYQGVTQVVYKLFQLVEPTMAFFGQKDFQQCMVIQQMIDLFNLPIHMEIVETVRAEDGLALSSRNVRLSPVGRQQALVLSKTLFKVREGFKMGENLLRLKEDVLKELHHAPGLMLEYFAICAAKTLREIDSYPAKGEQAVALLAAWVEGVRLIDNVLLHASKV